MSEGARRFGGVYGEVPRAVKVLVGVRVLNQVGAFALAFLAVFAGPGLAPVVLAVFGVAALVSRWGGGVLLDRLAPRSVIVLGLAATGAALVGLACARTFAEMVVATALVGLAFEIYEPATQEMLARVSAGGRREEAYRLLGTSLVAAGAIGGLVAAVLLPLGVRWLLVADAVTCVAAAVVAAFFLEKGGGRTVRARGRWRPTPLLLRLTLAGTAFACGYLAVMMFVPFLLLERGAPGWLPGVLLTAAALLAPLTAQLGRGALGRASHVVVLAAGTALLGAFAFLLALASGVVVTVVAYLGWVAADSLLLGRWQALIADAAPEADRPRWFAFHGSSWGIAQPAVPVLVGGAAGVAGGTGTAAMLVGAVAFMLVPLAMAMGGGRKSQTVEEGVGV